MFTPPRQSILRALALLVGVQLAIVASSEPAQRSAHSHAGSRLWVPAPALGTVDSSEDAHWWGGFTGANQLSGGVIDLTVFDGRLVAGGEFLWAGTTRVNCIASWNGTGWEGMGQGLEHGGCPGLACYPWVFALLPYGGDLIVGGHFIRAGGRPANYIARWDGAAWHPLGAGMDSLITALVEYEGELIAGGSFLTAGGQPIRYIARWNGSSWRSLGLGLNERVRSLAVWDRYLIAGGHFSYAGTTPASRIAAWDGTDWHPLGNGSRSPPSALTVFEGTLIADGEFVDAKTSQVYWLGRWDGASWTSMPGFAGALAVYRGKLVRGFGGIGSHVERWDGDAWRPLGSGTNEIVQALYATDSSLYVGGYFTMAGGKPSQYVARWDDIITPVRVEALQAHAVDSGVLLTWGLAGDELSEIASVEVQRAESEPGPYSSLTIPPLVPRIEMSYLDGAVDAGRVYWYRLRILGSDGGVQLAGPVGIRGTDASFATTLYAPADPGDGGPILVRYRIGRPTPAARLEVYSVRGRLVRTLVREPLAEGEYAHTWDRQDASGTLVASGVYFIRLGADRILARKVVLVPK